MFSSILSTSVALFTLFISAKSIPFSIRENNVTVSEPDCIINSICFVLDQSGSIDDDEYLIEQQFVIDVSRELNTRTTGILYSSYGFSNFAFVIQSSTTDLEGEFIPAVNLTARSSGGTNIRGGLDACFQEVRFSTGNRVIVVITDGEETGRESATELAPDVKSEGISIVTVGVGESVDGDFLRMVATTPAFFIDTSFDTLPSDIVRVAESSCDAVEVTPVPFLITPTPDPIDECQKAYDLCGFAFEGVDDVPTFSVDGPPDVAFTPIMVLQNARERLGVLNTNDISVQVIEDDGSARSITSLPASQTFSPTQFKPITVPRLRASGIGHESFQADQLGAVKNVCIRVSFSHFQLMQLSAPFRVVENVVADGMQNKCVVFRTL